MPGDGGQTLYCPRPRARSERENCPDVVTQVLLRFKQEELHIKVRLLGLPPYRQRDLFNLGNIAPVRQFAKVKAIFVLCGLRRDDAPLHEWFAWLWLWVAERIVFVVCHVFVLLE